MPRSVTEKESLRTLKSILGKENLAMGINLANHRKVAHAEGTYRITLDVISLAPVIKLMEHKIVKNVWWHPSASPPGAGPDGIALRYRLYVQYHNIATRKKSTP